MPKYSVNDLYDLAPMPQAPTHGSNPLTTRGSLNEAEFIDMRISPQRTRAGILCDIRWCASFEGSNTALIVLNGIGNISWSIDERSRQLPWHARYVTWEPQPVGQGESARPSLTDTSFEEMWALSTSGNPMPGAPGDLPSSAVEVQRSKAEEYVLVLGQLSIVALSAELYIGHVTGMDGAPPDMTELSDAEIIAGFPQWSSGMEVREHYAYPDASGPV